MGSGRRAMAAVVLVGGLVLALVGCGGGGSLTAGSSSDSASAQPDSGSSDRASGADTGSKHDDSGDDTSSQKRKPKHSEDTGDEGDTGDGAATTAPPTTTLGPASTSGTGGGTGAGTATGGGAAAGGDPNAGGGNDPEYDPEEGTGGTVGGDPGEATGGGGGATTGVGHDGLPLDLTNPFEVGRQWVLSANDGDFADVDRFSCHADAVAVASGEQHQASLAALRQMVATGFAPRDATTGYLTVNRLDLRTGISSDVTTPMIVEDGVWKVCYYPQYR